MYTQKKMKVRLVAALIMMVALGAVFGTGCTTTIDPEKRAAIRAEVADVMRFAYEVGGRAAYSNYVERMVADGKLTPDRAAQLHVISQEVFDRLVDKLDGTSGTLSTGEEVVLPPPVEKKDGDCPEGNSTPNGGECTDGNCTDGDCADCTVK
jgi:hypothetical protein